MTTRWIINTAVDYVSEKFSRQCIGGVGKNARFEETSLGWYVRLIGSSESFFIEEARHDKDGNPIEPDLHAGDRVKITIEKG